MLSRRTALGLSIVIAAVMHGLLFAVAPHVSILQAHSLPQEMLETFRVQLREPEVQPPVGEEPDATSRLASRPETIEDLLNREDEELTLNELLPDKTVELSELADRLAAELLEREYDLSQDADVLEKVDAKIVEIAQRDARREVEVARRLVRPSPTRVLGPDEFPTLRVETDDGRAAEHAIAAPPVASSLKELARPPSGITTAKAESAPPYDEDALRRETIEHKVTHAPVVERIREESPYEFIDDLVDIKLDAYVPSGEDRGYFQLRIAPKEDEAIEVLPKDVTFIVDASHSIVKRKLDLTAKGTKEIVAALRPEDRFNIVVFRDSATRFRPEAVPASSENKAAAMEFLERLESQGETDVYKGIRPVLDKAPRKGVPGIVLVMTDGRPTTGVRDGRTIINALTAENNYGNTIFAYGGGNTVNRYLLDLLAYRNKGESYVSDRLYDIADDLPKFFEQLNDPILVALQADYGRIDDVNVFPKEIPDFYRGRAVTVYGQFDPNKDSEFSMRLTGVAGDREKELVFKTDLASAASGDDRIARNWAFQKIYYLIGEICRVGEKPELLDELRRLSSKYNIKTSYD